MSRRSFFANVLRWPASLSPLSASLSSPWGSGTATAENTSGRPCRCIVRKNRKSIFRQSNPSLSARQIFAGKMFSEARDRAEIFGEDCLFRTTETGISRVSLTKATESQRLFRRRQETGFAQDCVVGPAGLEPATKRL